MKQKIIFYLLSYSLLSFNSVQANIFDVFLPAKQKVVIVGDVQKREHALDILTKEKEKLAFGDGQKEASKVLQDTNKINSLISDYKKNRSAAKDQEKEYFNIVLGVLSESAQLLLDIQLLRQKLTQTVDTHIQILKGYLKDPNFKSFRAEVSSVYSFSDLQKMYHNLLSLREKRRQQKDQLDVLKKEQDDAKHDASLITKMLKEKELEQTTINSSSRDNFVSGDSWGVAESAKLYDFEVKLLTIKKAWSELVIKELSYQIGMFSSRLEILDSKQEVLDDDLERIDRSLTVNDVEVRAAQEELVKKKNKATKIQTQYSQEISRLAENKKQLKEQFEKTRKQAKVELRSPQELDDWNIDPVKYTSEIAIYRLGYLNENIREVDNQIDIFEAKKTLERVRLAFDEVMVKIITSWHKISQRNLRSAEDIEKEVAKYVNNKVEGERIMLSSRDKQVIVSKNINNLSKSLVNLETRMKDIQKNSSKIIAKYKDAGYRQIGSMLDHSARILNKRINLNRNLTDVYTSIIEIEKDILRQVEVVEERLGKIGVILQRSQHAISWENIKNIGPNLSTFAFGLKNVLLSHLNDLSFASTFHWLKKQIEHPVGIFYLFLRLLALLLIFLLINQILVPLRLKLLSLRPRASNFGVPWGISLLAVETLSDCLLSFMVWCTLFFLLAGGWITGLGLQALFFLISIPYLCYVAKIMIHKFIRINTLNEYVIISESVEFRFVRVVSFFIYSTIIILFFREAFQLFTYESDLTKVLSALYSVIMRASIIFLIGRDELVSIIPKRGAVWDVIRNYITRYYYPLLVGIIAVMVVSDPYILGFSKLVTFVFWGIVLTLILLFSVTWLQDQVKKITAYAFFYSTDAGSRERFSNAKTWYGLLIVFSYFSVAAICILLLAKIWGYALNISDLYKWLDLELFSMSQGLDREAISVTPESFLTILTYLIFGIWLAWAFERFVLKKVFSILLVDSGAQNTISIISRYFISLIALSIGLNVVHLGGFIIYVFGALAFGVVWAIKDPVNDFISYFIILLDRTVKIGDFIEVDDRIVGVVRKISPRSVLIRRKNSVSIVVPNSKLTSMPVYNWGYTRGFFAFNDLKISVPYSSNAKQVKEVLQKILSENLNILKSPAPIIRLEDFGDYGYVFLVRGFLSSINVLNQWDIVGNIRLEIVEELRKIGVPIAAPLRLMVSRKDIKDLYNLEDNSKSDTEEDSQKEAKEDTNTSKE
jgi:small-conductance mechanosensitive channel